MSEHQQRELTRALVCERAGVTVATVSSTQTLIGDLGYDSLGVIELIDALETALDLPPVPDETVGMLETVADVEALALTTPAALPSKGAPC